MSCWGIEEEGIPFVLQPQTGGDLIHHAWQAAQRSPLQVGIACDRERLIVHYKNLPASTPLFSLMYHQNRLAPAKHWQQCGSSRQRDPISGSPCLIHRRTQYE
ncbi:propanediol dehydratase reactivation factor small subunit [Klebsiella pneumoniae]|uniref:Propanediol dehydratase reactivation factor small subunit n=1 Tax=Klebsiella pneumoniae TaxID=573 RepID=A0A377WQT7_KLEPN|nr:propanediol dehydratase reactivation factor small subunit [Klebsiella pneumoniae]